MRRSAAAALSPSAPVRPPLALRAVSCRAAIRQLGRGTGPKAPYHSPTGLPGVTGNLGWPRTLRGAPAGHSGKSVRNTTSRPSRASCRPPGTKSKVRSRRGSGEPNRSTGPPAATRLAGQ
ncbi:hypothetical protein [Sporomusa carbonis]|uniref:hypothetical protein n=1 Tax=Sporomusa carbonis TaxID=3076075 RepID=UPI003C7D605C